MVRAIEYAREKGRSIFPSCSYAVTFFRRHPEYKDVLAESADLDNGGSCRVV
ncbi:MAG: N-acetyltransferase [Chitinispirillaceae bacterium]|nr:N-acetyltransferase [Chitinispirillaceae bacterium]